jgi:hypothetical protein
MQFFCVGGVMRKSLLLVMTFRLVFAICTPPLDVDLGDRETGKEHQVMHCAIANSNHFPLPRVANTCAPRWCKYSC